MPTDSTDHDLPLAERVRAAQRGEEAAFTELVRESYPAVLHHALRLLRDPAEAQDCTQEAFAEAFSTLSALAEPRAWAAWLRSIVRHRCLRRLRRRDVQLIPLGPEIEALIPDLEGAERRRFVEQWAHAGRLIAKLPSAEREVTLLFYVKQCSQQEIASFLGLPLTTVNNRLHQARERLERFGEIIMTTTTSASREPAADRVSRIGTILHIDGPVIEVRFEPHAALDLFDPLALAGADGKTQECMLIARRRDDGVATCLALAGTEGLRVGTALLDTNPLTTGLSPFRAGVPAVAKANVASALAVLAPQRSKGSQRSAAPALLETGIKALDLLCPLPDHGAIAQIGTALVGRVVLLDELRDRLRNSSARLTCFCMVDETEPDTYRGRLPVELCDDVPALQRFWVLAQEPAEPAYEGLRKADALIYHSPTLAFQHLYPAIDPEHSWSKQLTPEMAGAEHVELARRAREALLLAKRAFADNIGLELISCRAFPSATRHLEQLARRVLQSASVELVRARKLQLFLTQPFETAHAFTGWQGNSVSRSDTLTGVRAILDGAADALPVATFAYRGNLDDVRAHVGEPKTYGLKG
ncbi:MAG: synthase subunit beta [Pseudomonadota bacterium]|jgi:RNA polymerase sigma factor (sigma-70 family)